MEWQDLGKELAKKLTPILAFGVLIIIVVALLGSSIPDAYQTLIYVVVIGVMLIYAAIMWVQLKGREKTGAETGSTPVDQPEVKPEPAPIPQSEPEPPHRSHSSMPERRAKNTCEQLLPTAARSGWAA